MTTKSSFPTIAADQLVDVVGAEACRQLSPGDWRIAGRTFDALGDINGGRYSTRSACRQFVRENIGSTLVLCADAVLGELAVEGRATDA